MMKSGKVWGTTSKLFNRNNVEVHLVHIEKGGYCSIHKHDHKFNEFVVIKGKVKLTEWKDDLKDRTCLESGDSAVISPGHFHQFKATEKTTLLEIYWVSLEENDIVRKTTGGKNV